MSDAYHGEMACYRVIEEDGIVVGGGGFAPLRGALPKDRICELQKIYLHKEARGKGYGRKLTQTLIKDAQMRQCKTLYLETVPAMVGAIKLYEGFGFRYLETPLGHTGHDNLSVLMALDL